MKSRHKRFIIIVLGLLVLGAAATLILNAFRSNLVFFSRPPRWLRVKRLAVRHFAWAVW